MRKWYDLLGSYHVRLKCVSLVKKPPNIFMNLCCNIQMLGSVFGINMKACINVSVLLVVV